MTQLDLFAQEEIPKPNKFVLPKHHEANGTGNIDMFLELHRHQFNQLIHTGQFIGELNYKEDIDTLKHILYAFDKDQQEWVYKSILNFRVNQLLHNQYEYLNEKYDV